eukprot:TRINITY_DN112295_c0_g1_i1.p1 TRINITY_DN112295_c0_g1~~TRINITY_DN112295_c0_g1_i1.p1  ORF type:complete len:232 (-),score=57.08 TRINITY_DN112295_c0_g1_i1:54-749(-)
MPSQLKLSEIADTILPRDSAEVSKLTGHALGNSKHLLRIYEDLDGADAKDDSELRQLYQLVDKMRVTAKDATNLVDRAFALSQAFLPQIESVYPCAGAARARSLAHALHIAVGQAKEVMGNPPPMTVGEEGPSDDSPLGSGASDLLARMERRIGTLQGMHPGGLVPMPNLEIAAMPAPDALTLALACRASSLPVRHHSRPLSFSRLRPSRSAAGDQRLRSAAREPAMAAFL